MVQPPPPSTNKKTRQAVETGVRSPPTAPVPFTPPDTVRKVKKNNNNIMNHTNRDMGDGTSRDGGDGGRSPSPIRSMVTSPIDPQNESSEESQSKTPRRLHVMFQSKIKDFTQTIAKTELVDYFTMVYANLPGSMLYVGSWLMTLSAVWAAYWVFDWKEFQSLMEAIYTTTAIRLCTMTGFTLIVAIYLLSRWIVSVPIYLVDFSVWEGAPDMEISRDRLLSVMGTYRLSNGEYAFDDDSLDFHRRICAGAGVGDRVHLPLVLQQGDQKAVTRAAAREEAKMVIFASLDNLFKRVGWNPATDVDILVVNCSLFNPTPSLSAMIVNHYKMPSRIRTYNLGGMGCSAGVIAVDLAADLLRCHPWSNAIVVSTENITQNFYLGKQKSMTLQNCLFRSGCGAVALTNKRSYMRIAKYKLVTTVRTHRGGHDPSFQAVVELEDPCGIRGVALSKDLMDVAGESLKANITSVSPYVLSYFEQAKFLLSIFKRNYMSKKGEKKPPLYTPKFNQAFQHFCIHAGGRAVLDALEKNLQLNPSDLLPSRETLKRWGNTSSSSIWYELAYCEAMGIQSGALIWQIAFGSGFKCNSAVWRARRTIKDVRPAILDCAGVDIPELQWTWHGQGRPNWTPPPPKPDRPSVAAN